MDRHRPHRFDGLFMSLIRDRMKVTFRELAKRTRSSPGHLHSVENGSTDPSFSLAVSISEALGVDVRHFVVPLPGRPKASVRAKSSPRAP
jgi:transcriptional regulator with XRE-family HTH domain